LTVRGPGQHTINVDTEIKKRRDGSLSLTATSDDARQLRAAVAGVLGAASTDDLPAPDSSWRDGWTALVHLGLPALCVDEVHDGLGLQVPAAVAAAAELGSLLHGSPFAGLTAAAHALAGSTDPRAETVLAEVLGGDRLCGFGRLDQLGVARVVDGVPGVEALVLQDPVAGDLLLLDEPGSWTATADPIGFDTSRTSSTVRVDAERGIRLASPTAGDLFGLLLAADALGGVERALARTVAYAGERQAFGRAIGGFQAVQHRLADHAVRVRGLSLAVQEAAVALAQSSPGARRRVALAELGVHGAAGHVLHDLLQLTGGIGFTWEYGLHHVQRRAHQDARLRANPRRAQQELADLEGWQRGRR
jgi:alkylation response protein AidB-like acyl-CoA dehydrogenase